MATKQQVDRTVARMIAEMGHVEYMGDRKAAPRRRRQMARLLLTEDELRAEDAAEEAELREQAESDRAEVRLVRP